MSDGNLGAWVIGFWIAGMLFVAFLDALKRKAVRGKALTPRAEPEDRTSEVPVPCVIPADEPQSVR